jgi:hypothetical protein
VLQRLLKGLNVESPAIIRQSVGLVKNEKTQRCVGMVIIT